MGRSVDSADGGVHERRGARRARESFALVAIGLVLLGTAAWSAARSRIGKEPAGLHSNIRGSDTALNDALLVAAGALAAAVIILVAPALMRQGRRPAQFANDEEPRPSRLWLRVFAGLSILFAVVLVIVLAAHHRPAQTEPLPVGAPAPEEIRPRAETRSGAHGWSAVALAAAGAVAVGTAVVVARRRGRRRGPMAYNGEDRRPVELPRRPVDFDALAPADAIRAAYAEARNELASLGIELRPPETPYQYLHRARESAPAVEPPVATLTRLFEVARFSHHPVTPAMKAEAIAAHSTIVAAVVRERDAAVLT